MKPAISAIALSLLLGALGYILGRPLDVYDYVVVIFATSTDRTRGDRLEDFRQSCRERQCGWLSGSVAMAGHKKGADERRLEIL